eukprot:9697959-Ditylum_brightwellii.AAC.1
MVWARAEMLNNDIVRQPGEKTGTIYNEAISAFEQVIPHLNKITEQRKKVLELLNVDKSNAYDDGLLIKQHHLHFMGRKVCIIPSRSPPIVM